MRTSNRRGPWLYEWDQNEERNNPERDYFSETNENYGRDDRYNRGSRPARGYGNPDYDDRNYDFNGQRQELEWGNGDQQYVPEMDYGPRRRNPRTQVTGYGNQNSRFMNEFEQWRNGPGDYENQSRYDTGQERGDFYGRDAERNRYDRYEGYRNEQTARYFNRSETPDYNYYESYPSYGQGAPYNDHERGYIRKQEMMGNRGVDNDDDYSYRRDDTGGRRRFSSNEFDRRHRPMIRDKRY